MKTAIAFLLLIYSFVSSFPTFADHPSVAFGSEASGPIGTIAATAMPRGNWAFGMRTEFIDSDEFSDATLVTAAEQGNDDVHSINYLSNSSISLAYGVTEDLSISVRLPWVDRNNIREGELEEHHEEEGHGHDDDGHGSGEGEAHGHGDASGLGDLVVLTNYRAFQTDATDYSLQIGFKAPTGEGDESDVGERLETEFQPSSGSWDFLVGGAVSHSLGRWGFHANVLYHNTSEGSQQTELGDALFYNVAAVYSLSERDAHHEHEDVSLHSHLKWDVMLEFNGEKRWENEISGREQINSGGDIVYLSPGVRLSYGKFGAFLSVGIPIVDDTNGLQTDVNFRMIGGIGMAF